MNWFRCFKFIAGWFPPSFFSTRKRLINSPSKLIRSYNKRKLKQGVKKNTSFLIFSYFSLSTPKKYFLLFLFFFKTISASFTSLSQPVSVLRKGEGGEGAERLFDALQILTHILCYKIIIVVPWVRLTYSVWSS